MAPPEPKKPDPLVLLAQASAAKRRRPVWPTVILLLLVGGLVGSFVWWVWPHSEYPALALAVFDHFAVPGSTVPVTTSFEQLEPSAKDPSINGSRVFLQEAGSAEFQETTCDASGFARFEYAAVADRPVTELVARHPGTPGRRRASEGRARVYVLPPETGLLIVDADKTLIDADEADRWTTNVLDLKPVAGAAAALQAPSKKMGIVYLSSGADRATRYHRLRAWLLSEAERERGTLPAGPLLAAASVPEEDRTGFAEATLARLCEQYRGKHAGVTRDPALAALFRKAGVEAWLLTDSGEAPEGVRAVKSWEEFQKAFKP